MRATRRRRFALLGGALALTFSTSLVQAQDGQPVVGPPVTAPKTNKNKANEVTETPPTAVGSQVLPGVPATASDPAPPGTRALPAEGAPATAAPRGRAVPAAPAATASPDLPPGVMMAEGVVTKLSKPGDALPEERIRFDLNTGETWANFASATTGGLPTTPAPKAETKTIDRAAQKLDDAAKKLDDAAAKIEGAPRRVDNRPQPAPAGRPRVLPVVITRKTNITKYARTPDGQDLLGGNPNATDIKTSSTGVTNTGVTPDQLPQAANFTNIHEGSFVAIRYRRAGDVNEALSLSIIEMPRTPVATPNPAAVVPTQSPATPAVPVVPGRAPATGGNHSGVVPVVPTTPGRATAAPVRTPVVPTTPVGPGGP